MKSRLSRSILVLHRYTGVLIGVLMTVWCLSGFVMMYQGFPAVTEQERLAAAQPVDLSGPLALEALPFADDEELRGFRIDMLGDRPILRMGGRGGGGAYDLRSGAEVEELPADQVAAIARRYANGNGIEAASAIRPILMDDLDQWTIQTFRGNEPLYKVPMGDPAGTELYVSAASGSVVQDTNRAERVLSWLGAIPHWLYPTVLRQNGPLWSQVVIWTSVIGTFLTITGLYVGIGRIRLGSKGKAGISPYRGLWYWHHMLGLFFGVITMTWVFSGLMTMGDWGLSPSRQGELREQVAGNANWGDTRNLLQQLSTADLPADTRQLRPTMLGGHLHLLADDGGGRTVRIDAHGDPMPVTDGEIRSALFGMPLATLARVDGEDAYHYSFKDREVRPAYRAILADEQQTRIYFDASTGEVGRVIDDAARQSRWLRNGMHSLDFIRGRPLWDALTLILLAGVTAVCATGAWMSFRRVGRDIKMLRRRAARKAGRNGGNPEGKPSRA